MRFLTKTIKKTVKLYVLNYDTLFSFIASVAMLAILPGPDNIYVLMQSVVHGKKFGLATVFGLMTGCIIHTTLVAFGVSSILRGNDTVFFTLKILGASYLLFLAYKVYESDSTINLKTDTIQKKTVFELFKLGFLMNVLNPKVTIFFLALFPGFLFSNSLSSIIQFYILGGLFILVSFIIFSLIAILGGIISDKLQESNRIEIWFKWLQISVFIGIALFILL